MAQLEVRLERGLLYFYLEGTRLSDGVRLEYLRPSAPVNGRFHTRPDPFGAELILDKPHRGRFLRLTETSDLRHLASPLPVLRSKDLSPPTATPSSSVNPTLHVAFKRGKLSLRLGKRPLAFSAPLLLHHRDRWIPGTLRYLSSPARLVLQTSQGYAHRLTPTSELRFPATGRSSRGFQRQRRFAA